MKLLIFTWTLAIILEILSLRKNKKLMSFIIPVLFTLFFVLTEFGKLTTLYLVYVILSWGLFFIYTLIEVNKNPKSKINKL
ncbi:MAG: hypothetical protein K0R15_2094 [Clostridiales bacterium]|jgi:hypothetical protein|nr:hypothetical protein [Clostridiales bacterium]